MHQDVTFTSSGNRIVGQLHLPGDTPSGDRVPGVVVVGPASSVKGQVPTVYAERLAEFGYAALAFDHATYGESEGWPRSDEDPFAKIEDIKNAVTFLTGHDRIDADRLAAVGVCAGGGYAPAATVADRRIKVLATVSGITDLRSTIKAAADDWRTIMIAADNAREEYARSGRPVHVPFLGDGELDIWRENGKKFYLTDRNKDPNWRNETLLWSYDKMIQFSAIDTADLLAPTPLLVIAGSQAETLEHSERLYEHAQQVKELHVIEGGTHFDFYDQPQYVDPAVTKINEFFRNHLQAQPRRRRSSVNPKTVVTEFWETYGRGQLDEAWSKYLAENIIVHPPPPMELDRESWLATEKAFFAAFDDIDVKVLDQVADGDKVASRWSMTARQTAEFYGVPSGGRTATVTGTYIDIIRDDKIVEHWSEMSLPQFMQALAIE